MSYSEILLTSLPLVVRRRLLDYSALHEGPASERASGGGGGGGGGRAGARGSSAGPSSPAAPPARSSSLLLDPVTTMWEQELASVRCVAGGSATLAVMPHWLEAINPPGRHAAAAAAAAGGDSSAGDADAGSRGSGALGPHQRVAGRVDSAAVPVAVAVLRGTMSLPAPPQQLVAHLAGGTRRAGLASNSGGGGGASSSFARDPHHRSTQQPLSASVADFNSIPMFETAANYYEAGATAADPTAISSSSLMFLAPLAPPVPLPESAAMALFLARRDSRAILMRKTQAPAQREYALRESKDALARDLERCTALMAPLCGGGSSVWLVGGGGGGGGGAAFTEPLVLSRRLLDRLCACLHLALQHAASPPMRQQRTFAAALSGGSSDNKNTKTPPPPRTPRPLPTWTLPLALLGPARLVAPVSFAERAPAHFRRPLAAFLARCFVRPRAQAAAGWRRGGRCGAGAAR